MRLGLLIAAAGFLLSGTASASDLIREQRIAEQIADAILVGEPLQLQAGEVEFLAIHSEAETGQPRGGVIVLHGRGAHPDWVDVVHPLRSELPAAGWETLSLQMPVAAADAPDGAYRALIPEAYPRITAGLEFFRERGISRMVLIGHSLGARMAVTYLGTVGSDGISGLVLVGVSANEGPKDATLEALEKITLPVLDIYGSRDLDSVMNSVKQRADAARRAGSQVYRQDQVPGADHFFSGLSETLVARVRAWLARFEES